MIVALPDLKHHLRVDYDDEDSLIATYGLAAEGVVRAWIGRPIYPVGTTLPEPDSPEYHPFQMIADEPVRVSIMMLTARMFGEDRAGGGSDFDPSVPPLAVRSLLAGHRVFAGGACA